MKRKRKRPLKPKPLTDKQFNACIRALRAEVAKLPIRTHDHPRHEKMLGLCRKYLLAHHQLKQLEFHLSPQVVSVGVYVCNKPPCM